MQPWSSPESVLASISKLCRTVFFLLLVLLMLLHLAGPGLAQTPISVPNNPSSGTHKNVVPEIDPSSLAGAIALVGFGTAVLIGRRRRK
jgi:hypothetical protein